MILDIICDNEKIKKEIEKIVYFCCYKFWNKQLPDFYLYITADSGECVDYSFTDVHKDQSYSIYVHDYKKELFQILVHEMTHVYQYHEKKLKNVYKNVYSWNNELYTFDNSDEQYKMLPWETEARSNEHEFAKHYRTRM